MVIFVIRLIRVICTRVIIGLICFKIIKRYYSDFIFIPSLFIYCGSLGLFGLFEVLYRVLLNLYSYNSNDFLSVRLSVCPFVWSA
jgi:hypothetical protein